MNIGVCIKVSPDPAQYNKIKTDKVTNTIIRAGTDSVISSADLHALELALQLKDAAGASVTLISMGPPSSLKQLRFGLAYGADRAVLLSDPLFGGADALATSYTLSKGIEKTGPYDLILTGNSSDDGATAHIPSQLGEWLNLPHLTDLTSVSIENNIAVVKKSYEDRERTFRVELPAVFGVSRSINDVRIPKVKDIFDVKGKELLILGADQLDGLNLSCVGLSGSPTQATGYAEAGFKRQCLEISGSSSDIADEIRKIIASVKR